MDINYDEKILNLLPTEETEYLPTEIDCLINVAHLRLYDIQKLIRNHSSALDDSAMEELRNTLTFYSRFLMTKPVSMDLYQTDNVTKTKHALTTNAMLTMYVAELENKVIQLNDKNIQLVDEVNSCKEFYKVGHLANEFNNRIAEQIPILLNLVKELPVYQQDISIITDIKYCLSKFKKADVNTLGDLAILTSIEIIDINGIGETTIEYINNYFIKNNIISMLNCVTLNDFFSWKQSSYVYSDFELIAKNRADFEVSKMHKFKLPSYLFGKNAILDSIGSTIGVRIKEDLVKPPTQEPQYTALPLFEITSANNSMTKTLTLLVCIKLLSKTIANNDDENICSAAKKWIDIFSTVDNTMTISFIRPEDENRLWAILDTQEESILTQLNLFCPLQSGDIEYVTENDMYTMINVDQIL